MRRWLVDGMNVIGSRPDGWWRDRRQAQRRFAAQLAEFASATGDAVRVVFDGRAHDIDAPGVHVSFAAVADDEIANDAGEGTWVVTSDAELSARVRARGARVEGAGTFRRRLDDCRET